MSDPHNSVPPVQLLTDTYDEPEPSRWSTHPAAAQQQSAQPGRHHAQTIFDAAQMPGSLEDAKQLPEVRAVITALEAAAAKGDDTARALALAKLEQLEARGMLGPAQQPPGPGPLSAEAQAILNAHNERASKLNSELGLGPSEDRFGVPLTYQNVIPHDDPVLAAGRGAAMQAGITQRQWNMVLGAMLSQLRQIGGGRS